jgi:hypothetical protein
VLQCAHSYLSILLVPIHAKKDRKNQEEFLEVRECTIVSTGNKSMGRNSASKGYNPDTNSYVHYTETKGLLGIVSEAIALGTPSLNLKRVIYFV